MFICCCYQCSPGLLKFAGGMFVLLCLFLLLSACSFLLIIEPVLAAALCATLNQIQNSSYQNPFSTTPALALGFHLQRNVPAKFG